MSVESSDRPKAESRDPKSDFFELLKLADDLQDKCDRSAQRIFFSRVLGFTACAALTAAGVAFSITNVKYTVAYTLLGLLAGAVYAAVIELQLARRVTTRLKRDERALSEVVELLRETERSVAEQERLTPLERARLRLEMSRFGI